MPVNWKIFKNIILMTASFETLKGSQPPLFKH